MYPQDAFVKVLNVDNLFKTSSSFLDICKLFLGVTVMNNFAILAILLQVGKIAVILFFLVMFPTIHGVLEGPLEGRYCNTSNSYHSGTEQEELCGS